MDSRECVRVVGGGLTGLSAAVLLAQRGKRVTLWEPRPVLGGLLAPAEFHGLRLDLGSHRVHPQARAALAAMVPDVEWDEQPRRGVLVLGDRQVAYPLRLGAFLRGLGWRRAARLGAAWVGRPGAWSRFKDWEEHRAGVGAPDVGFEDFVLGRAGRAALEAFYAPYARKVWGLEPAQLSQTVARQRVSTQRPWDSLLRGAPQTFHYPRTGMAGLLDGLRARALALGVTPERRSFSARDVDGVTTVFTGHLGALAQEPALCHRGLYLLHLWVDVKDPVATDTWYVPDGQYLFGRVSQVSRFSSSHSLARGQVFCVEIPQGAWGTQQDFLARLPQVVDQLRRANILGAQDTVRDAHQTLVPDVYPLYTRGWRHAWRRAVERVGGMGPVFPVGRQGLFLHCNMDHCVEMAHAVVDHVLANSSTAAWGQQARAYLELRVRD